MTEEKIARINALAKKAKAEGLTSAEEAERAELRKEYLELMRQSLEAQLANTVVEGPDGKRRPLKKKTEGPMS